jgi:hypothetical protein
MFIVSKLSFLFYFLLQHLLTRIFSSVTLGLTFQPSPEGPQNYSSWHAMTSFAVVLGTNLLGLAVVIIRGDIVWCVAATWVAVSIWTATPKPAPVNVS